MLCQCSRNYVFCLALLALAPIMTTAHGQGFELLKEDVSLTEYLICGGKIFFVSSDYRGPELWITDGTAAGTRCVKDIWPGRDGSCPANLTVYKDLVWFTANIPFNPDGGCWLWKSDGTEAGTVRIHRGFTTQIVAGHDALYFAVDNWSAKETGLWKTDGTNAGTVMVAKTAQVPYGLIKYGKEIVFSVEDRPSPNGMSITDGTPGGTKFLAPIQLTGSHHAEFRGELYFSATHERTGTELWKTDGTPAGTRLVKDINWDRGGSYPSWICVWHDRLYFSAYVSKEQDYGVELCSSDGTEAGTEMVVDLRHGPSNSNPALLFPLKNALLFTATTDQTGYSLLRTDGTPHGTTVLLSAGLHAGNTKVAENLPGQLYQEFENRSYELEKEYIRQHHRTPPNQWRTLRNKERSLIYTFGGLPIRNVFLNESRDNLSGFLPSQSDIALFVVGEREFVDELNRLMVWGTDGTPAGTRPYFPIVESHHGQRVITSDKLFWYGRKLGFSGYVIDPKVRPGAWHGDALFIQP